MSRPYTDISAIDPLKPINNITTICSTSKTGYSAKRVTLSNFPVGLSIVNIQQKFGNRFYNGIFVNVVSGDINGGSSIN